MQSTLNQEPPNISNEHSKHHAGHITQFYSTCKTSSASISSLKVGQGWSDGPEILFPKSWMVCLPGHPR